jgi:hypothetical protein
MRESFSVFLSIFFYTTSLVILIGHIMVHVLNVLLVKLELLLQMPLDVSFS